MFEKKQIHKTTFLSHAVGLNYNLASSLIIFPLVIGNTKRIEMNKALKGGHMSFLLKAWP